MVDNLHLLRQGVHGKQHENRLQELGEIHRSLKALAAELNIPVVVFAPIACAVASRHAKSPKSSDQGESSQEEAIDHVLFLYRDELSAPVRGPPVPGPDAHPGSHGACTPPGA